MATLALGLIETRGLVAAIEAADAAAKAATITLVSAELLGGGIVTLRIRGDLGAVQAAVEVGAQAARRIGEVLAVRVIPRPVAELDALAPSHRRLGAEQDPDTSRTISVHTRSFHHAPAGARSDTAEQNISGGKSTLRTPRSRTLSDRASITRPKAARQSTNAPATQSVAEPVLPVSPTVTAPRSTPATASRGRTSMSDLEAMSVARLRQYARTVRNLPIQGRQISMANKTQLLDAIRQVVTLD